MNNNSNDKTNNKPIVDFKAKTDGLEVEFEVIPIYDSSNTDSIKQEINDQLHDIDEKLASNQEIIDKLNSDIDKLTSHADGLDYVLATLSGVLSGMIDSFFVGETIIDKEKIQKELEKKYHTPNDSAYTHKENKDDNHWIDSAMYHRLDDLAHHPTLGGLVASILVRFFRLVVFIDGTDGKPHIFFADKTNNNDVLKKEMEKMIIAWAAATFSGLLWWLSTMAEKKYYNENNEEIPEPLRKIIKTITLSPIILEVFGIVDTWIGHMMSDVSTSQGIPGVFLSFLKEISVLPWIRNTNLPVIVDSLYRKGSMNLSEWGGVAFTAIKKQALPVLLNEALVRGFYFVRHLVNEVKHVNSINQLDWNKVIPFGNRTVERMMTIATSTFTAVDVADAAIRSGGFKNPQILLRINYVGIGRFVIAIGVDTSMGFKRSKLRNERIAVCFEQLYLLNAKTYYKQANMWQSAKNAEEAIKEMQEMMAEATYYFNTAFQDIDSDMKKINKYIPLIENKNPGLLDDIDDILNWG